jgi:hypothetical protein
MVINDVIRITDEIRSQLSDVFKSQFNDIETSISEFLTFKDTVYSGSFDYHNYYKEGHNNIIRAVDNKPMMSVFNFNIKNSVKIFRLLQLEKFKPQLSGIRVYANTNLPMHIDMNRGGVGREYPIYSIMLSGKDGMVFFSNKSDGSRLVAIPPLSEFVMHPTLMQHGALTGAEDMDVLQIQLGDMY